jgi:hypothetical protein
MIAVVLIVIAAILTSAPIVAAGLVSVASRREDTDWSLARPACGWVEAAARRVVGFDAESVTWPRSKARRHAERRSVAAVDAHPAGAGTGAIAPDGAELRSMGTAGGAEIAPGCTASTWPTAAPAGSGATWPYQAIRITADFAYKRFEAVSHAFALRSVSGLGCRPGKTCCYWERPWRRSVNC